MTNADRIRAMTDEELAKYLAWMEDVEACYEWELYGDADRITEWLDWLKEAVDAPPSKPVCPKCGGQLSEDRGGYVHCYACHFEFSLENL